MKLRINTPLEAFENDIADIVRIFYGEGAVVTPCEAFDAQLHHEHTVQNGIWRERFTFTQNDYSIDHVCEAPSYIDGGLEEKRQLKRLVKRCCYELFKRHTCRKPAWGSLTGIRPTRLYYQQMEGGKTRAQARTALGELFDLSCEKLDLLEEIITAQEGLITRLQNSCDLYIGIPFCTTRCSYCSFSSGEIGNGKLVEPYLNALFHEIDLCSEMMREMSYSISVGYIGGGTPSSLTTEQLDRLLTHIEKRFGYMPEFTVEAGRPDTLDREKLSMMRSHPVTRISINPQTMNDETLKIIGRAHTAQQTIDAYELARSLGYTEASGNGTELIITPSDFEVYDEAGATAAFYSCSHSDYVSVSTEGTKDSGFVPVVLKNNSSSITFIISKYDSDGVLRKARFTAEITD